ncbi:MAG: hypothetical protein HZB67_00715 [Candidatus Aenigmarchaeota archaeon]|nr:hypothetical protein [Candidatus Aenigmarchaeota archaeon]
MDKKKIILTGIFLVFLAAIMNYYYYEPSTYIARGQGTVLSDNWWEALNWIKNNTEECVTVATYWDPGHFITGIADRAVVFDGASQNSLLVMDVPGASGGLKIIPYDNGIKQLSMEQNGTITHARIKDIGISLLTSNETLALDILKNYRKPNCSEMYYIASSDLIFKSQWWTYFATWDPTVECDTSLCKGAKYFYSPIQFSKNTPLFFLKTVGYEYPVSDRQSFILYADNTSLHVLFQQDNNFVKVSKILLMTNEGFLAIEDPAAEMKGTVLVPGFAPGYTPDYIFYMSPELEDAMFTKMFFLNGAGLKNFEFVNSWGNEVKLFRIKFNETS